MVELRRPRFVLLVTSTAIAILVALATFRSSMPSGISPPVAAPRVPTTSSVSPKYVLCTLIQNEARYIREWVAFQIIVGFDR